MNPPLRGYANKLNQRTSQASDQLSGRLLRPILSPRLTALTTHHGLRVTPAVRAALTAASCGHLGPAAAAAAPRQSRRLAPALASLGAQVPLRTWSEWTGVRPSALQGDLVLHCGESTAGRYCATLVAVDVATSWTELRLAPPAGHGGIQHLAQRLPFPHQRR